MSSRGSELDQLAQVHDADPLGHVLDHREVVRDHHVGQAVRGLQPLHQVEHLRPDRHVERADRLVGHDELRVQGERPGQADALPLTAGKLMRIALDRVPGQSHLAEQLEDAVLLRPLAAEALHGERLCDDRADPHPRVERRVRILEHELQVAALAPEFAAMQAGHVHAAEGDSARVRLLQRHDHLADRGFAAPRLSHQAERRAGGHRERHIRDGLDTRHLALQDRARGDGEFLHQVAQLEQGDVLARSRPPPCARSPQGGHRPSPRGRPPRSPAALIHPPPPPRSRRTRQARGRPPAHRLAPRRGGAPGRPWPRLR